MRDLNQWRTIKTAPRDGTKIQIMVRKKGKWQIIGNTHWKKTMSHRDGGYWVSWTHYYDPTHWRPLPLPPQEGE